MSNKKYRKSTNLLTPIEAADYLGYSRTRFDYYLRKNIIPKAHEYLDGELYYTIAELEGYKKNGKLLDIGFKKITELFNYLIYEEKLELSIQFNHIAKINKLNTSDKIKTELLVKYIYHKYVKRKKINHFKITFENHLKQNKKKDYISLLNQNKLEKFVLKTAIKMNNYNTKYFDKLINEEDQNPRENALIKTFVKFTPDHYIKSSIKEFCNQLKEESRSEKEKNKKIYKKTNIKTFTKQFIIYVDDYLKLVDIQLFEEAKEEIFSFFILYIKSSTDLETKGVIDANLRIWYKSKKIRTNWLIWYKFFKDTHDSIKIHIWHNNDILNQNVIQFLYDLKRFIESLKDEDLQKIAEPYNNKYTEKKLKNFDNHTELAGFTREKQKEFKEKYNRTRGMLQKAKDWVMENCTVNKKSPNLQTLENRLKNT